MDHDITAEQMLDAFKLDVPGHARGTRWAQTTARASSATSLRRTSRRTSVSADISGRACRGDCPIFERVVGRGRHDQQPDTRGLAVKFHDDDGTDYDLLS
jgi:hypothetical protein